MYNLKQILVKAIEKWIYKAIVFILFSAIFHNLLYLESVWYMYIVILLLFTGYV